jgi:hypothetical protein
MGGKSRKSGGVSEALIARIKAGKFSCGTKKPKNDEESQETLFGKD